MNALVTGGAGFIGSTIVRLLLQRGDDVRVFDNLETGFEENVPPGAQLIHGDVRDADALERAMEGRDVVFHQAAMRSVPRSVDEPLVTDDINVRGTLNVLLAAERAQVRRLVFASSSSIYGNVDDVCIETLPPAPLSPYAVSKLAAEQYCAAWARLGRLSTVALRYFNVFGPGQRPDSQYAAVFPAFVSALVEGRAPEIHGDGEQSRDFVYVEDVARANICAADAGDAATGAVVNIGGGTARTINDVLKAVAAAAGRWVEPMRAPGRAGDPRASTASITRAKDLLGWEPSATWDAAVQATVEWFGAKPGAR